MRRVRKHWLAGAVMDGARIDFMEAGTLNPAAFAGRRRQMVAAVDLLTDYGEEVCVDAERLGLALGGLINWHKADSVAVAAQVTGTFRADLREAWGEREIAESEDAPGAPPGVKRGVTVYCETVSGFRSYHVAMVRGRDGDRHLLGRWNEVVMSEEFGRYFRAAAVQLLAN